MRPGIPRLLARIAGTLPCALLLLGPVAARSEPAVHDSTWVDHDRAPIPRPPDWEPNYWGQQVRQGFMEPLSHLFDVPDKLLWAARQFGVHTRDQAANANAFDEAPNSAWFTNRNHRSSVPVAELRRGPYPTLLPAKPWTITHAKQSGFTSGFQIKDAEGKKWLVKLDPRGYPQLGSGADMVARTLLHASGYNVPHNEPVRFVRGDVAIDPDRLRGAEDERFTNADLESVLVRGAVFPDGSYSASASLFLVGHALGSPSMNRKRPGDTNDWYTHVNRRALRGLFVLCSWINDWDTKDHQFLDMFVETRDSLGHVEHYILDAGSSFGAGAMGPKPRLAGYEYTVDLKWIARRLVTLGFVEEPWRRARQETGIPSVGNYESAVYEPQDFRQLMQQPAFREMTDRDGYWGAKIVASFSDEQIAAAVDAAQYDDPRATEFLVRNLIIRRDKIARYWFGRVAPLDFFQVQDGALRFRDLAVDVGLERARAYEVEVDGGRRIRLSSAVLPLAAPGKGTSRRSLTISLAERGAKPAAVELTWKDSEWVVTRVKHG